MKKVNELCKAVFSEDTHQAEALVVENVADGAQALLVGTSATKACYHLAIGRKCFKNDKCGFSHADEECKDS